MMVIRSFLFAISTRRMEEAQGNKQGREGGERRSCFIIADSDDSFLPMLWKQLPEYIRK